MKRTCKIRSVLVCIALATACLCQGQLPTPQSLPGGVDAEASGADLSSPLGVRQQRVKRMLVDLEKKFTELASKLSEEAPEQAEKLEEAFKQSKELLLMQRMDKITRLLDDTKLESANDEQQQIIGDLKKLIDLLLYEESEAERLQREIEKLERWKAALDNIIKAEAELKEDSETLADPEQAKKELQAKIDDAKDLIREQEKILEATENNDGSDLDALDALADQQDELRKETEAFAEALNPGEKEASQDDASAQAAQAMKQAAKSQREAEKQLASGKPKDAGEAEKDALSQLKKAAEALEKQAESLDQLGEETGGELASEQEANSEKTGELGEEMAKDGETGAAPQESVQNAQQQMDQAAQQLSQNQAGQASQNQQEAIDELNKAREEVERQLNELRDQAQQEQIAQLEEAFKKMLQRQQQITGSTRELAAKRDGDDKELKRADRITLRELAKDERGLEVDARSAEDLLLDDGTSVVFRDIVGYLQQEIANVAELMEKRQTGTLVQASHIEIENTLQELIAALENSGAGQQAPPPEGQQPPGEPQQQRQNLFPPIAELKLLKFTQERINRRTTSIEQAQENPDLEETLARQLNGVAGMQDKLTNMARQLAVKLQQPSPVEDLDSID